MAEQQRSFDGQVRALLELGQQVGAVHLWPVHTCGVLDRGQPPVPADAASLATKQRMGSAAATLSTHLCCRSRASLRS